MPENLVQSVAEAGTRLVTERDQYTYTQRFRFLEMRRGRPVGRYEEFRYITFTGTGERDERFKKHPIDQLHRLRLTHEDFRDLRDINPFVLTEDSLWFYRVTYKGIEPIDGMDCYTLHVRPRQILDDQRFFDGLIWVGKENGQVVRISGRPVPQIHRMENSNLFPAFTTQYAPVDGEHWFPVRTEGDDILPFPWGNQHVRLLIEYYDYKRFTAESKVTFEEPIEDRPEP